jgi:hypothetical protein
MHFIGWFNNGVAQDVRTGLKQTVIFDQLAMNKNYCAAGFSGRGRRTNLP